VSPAQRSSDPSTDKRISQGSTSGLASMGASALFPPSLAAATITGQAQAVASITHEALSGAASTYSLIGELSRSTSAISGFQTWADPALHLQSVYPFSETARVAVASRLLDAGLGSILDEARSIILDQAQFAHTVRVDAQSILQASIIPNISRGKEISTLAQVGSTNIMESLRFDFGQSLQRAASSPFAAMSQTMLGGAVSPFAMPLQELAGNAVAQMGSMLQAGVIQSAQSILGQIGTLVTRCVFLCALFTASRVVT
jgi:hypothetical protein